MNALGKPRESSEGLYSRQEVKIGRVKTVRTAAPTPTRSIKEVRN
jgi:hypothetical protein